MKKTPQAEWARTQQRAPARSRVEQMNDNALEWAIFLARIYTLTGGAGEVVMLMVAAISGDPGVWLAAGIHLLVVLATGWFGWWQYGNPEWRTPKAKGEK